jgi:hypothetical protein
MNGSNREHRKAAFAIKTARDLDIKNTKLAGFDGGVVDADKIRDIRTDNLEATAKQGTHRWRHLAIEAILALIAAVVGGWLLHHFFSVG